MTEKITLRMNADSTFRPEPETACTELPPHGMLLRAGACAAGRVALRLMEQSHVRPSNFEISLSGELDTDSLRDESLFTSFRLHFNVACRREQEQTAVSHALRLTLEQACGTTRMLGRIAPVSCEIVIVSTEPDKGCPLPSPPPRREPKAASGAEPWPESQTEPGGTGRSPGRTD